LREALILIETHPWGCPENYIGFERDNEIIQFIRFSRDQWLIDVPKQVGDVLEVYQNDSLNTESVRRIVEEFARRGNWRAYCNLCRVKIEKIKPCHNSHANE